MTRDFTQRRRGRPAAQPDPRVQEPGAAHPVDRLPAAVPGRLRGRPVERRQRPGLRLPVGLHGVPVRLRLPAVGGLRRRLHRLRHRRRLRDGLRAAAAARRAAARGHHRWATCWRRSARCAGHRRPSSRWRRCSPGMQVDGGGVELVGLVVARAAGQRRCDAVGRRAWRCASKSLQAGPAMQIPVFLILFLAPVYVPLDLLERLDPHAASLQPADGAPRGGPRVHLRASPRGRRSPTWPALGLVARRRSCGR